MRIYRAVPEHLAAFHEFFRAYLLSAQLRHGARLIRRWQTEDNRVADPASQRAQEQRARLPALVTATEETFMSSTIT